MRSRVQLILCALVMIATVGCGGQEKAAVSSDEQKAYANPVKERPGESMPNGQGGAPPAPDKGN